MVNDIVRGTISVEDVTVNVNGIQDNVSNRVYQAENIPRVAGINTLRVIAEVFLALNDPLSVQLTENGEAVVAGHNVVFRVIEGDGLLAAGSAEHGRGQLVVTIPIPTSLPVPRSSFESLPMANILIMTISSNPM